MDEGVYHVNESPYGKASLLSRICISWMSATLKRGYTGELGVSDLYNLIPAHRADVLYTRLQRYWTKDLNGKQAPSLFKSILRTYLSELCMYTALAWFQQLLRISLPLQITYFVSTLDEQRRRKTTEVGQPITTANNAYCYTMAASIAVTMLSISVIGSPLYFGLQIIGMKIRISLCNMIYKKSLRLSQASLDAIETGKIINLMTNDVRRFNLVMMYFPFVFIAPVGMLTIFVILYRYIGWSTGLGYVVLVAVVSVQAYLSRHMSKYRYEIASFTDKRLILINEIISGIKVIKYYCWERYFSTKISNIRKSECNTIMQSMILRAIGLRAPQKFATMLAVCLTIIIGSGYGPGDIDTRAVFILFGLYAVLKYDVMTMFPSAMFYVFEVLASINRIQNFLEMEEIHVLRDREYEHNNNHNNNNNNKNNNNNNNNNDSDTIRTTSEQYEITVEELSVRLDQDGTSVTVLDNVSFKVKRGELIIITGPVGSGKTSLLLALLGELPIADDSKVILAGDNVSYSAQEPWIFSSSLRQNILFGLPMDEDRYRRTCEAVSLNKSHVTQDLSDMPNRDATAVGDRGMSLSGGQKDRLSLARTVYADADVVLMDGPLSSLDAVVGRHVFDKCINGVLKSKTRILVTHHQQYMKQADRVLVIDGGKLIANDSYDNIIKSGLQISKYFCDNTATQTPDEEATTIENKRKDKQNVELDNNRNADLNNNGETMVSNKNAQIMLTDLNSTDQKSTDQKSTDLKPTDLKPTDQVEFERTAAAATGFDRWKLYWHYVTDGKVSPSIGLAFLLEIFTYALMFSSDWYLIQWSTFEHHDHEIDSNITFEFRNNSTQLNATSFETTEQSPFTFMSIYIGSILMVVIFASVSMITLNRVLLKAAAISHTRMLHSLLMARTSFFDHNPSGRILNRFSKEQGLLDDSLTVQFSNFYSLVILILCKVTVSCVINPIGLLCLVPLGWAFMYIRSYYLRSSRNLKTLDSITRSPILSHVTASMRGLATIRTHGMQATLQRDFERHQDQNTEAWFMYIAASKWMSLRIDLLCVAFIGILCFSSVAYSSTYSIALVGLSLLYAMDLIGNFQWTIKLSVEVENMMTSVERINEYSHLPNEGSSTERVDDTLVTWPIGGDIHATQLCMKYGDHLPLTLNRVNFSIKTREKIGIVGRTGSGKSTLMNAMFRMVQYTGQIIIDGVDIQRLGLAKLRSKISIIPQDPVLFIGTLRDNLDPYQEFEDNHIHSTLKKVKFVLNSDGLEFKVHKEGSNFSVGQKQLICLARALLMRNNILIIDEATANIDNYTDGLIQETIKENFVNCTILTIAHRLQTIIDSDRIMVLENGELKEFDKPAELLNNENGLFHELAKNSGDLKLFKSMLRKEKQ